MEIHEEFVLIRTQIEKLAHEKIPTGILSLPSFNKIEAVKEQETDKTTVESYRALERFLTDISFGALGESEYPTYKELIESAKKSTVEMGVFHLKFNRLSEENEAQLGTLKKEERLETLNLETLIDEAITEEERFVCLPLTARITDGATATFNFGADFMYDNTGETLTEIEFDAGDGKGFRSVGQDQLISIHYTEKGTKSLHVRMHFGENVVEMKSTVDVIAVNLPNPDRLIRLTARHFHRGKHAGADIRIYYANKDKKLMKPLYFWTGFDTGQNATNTISTPLDAMDISSEELFATHYDRFLKVALDHGYDIVTARWNNSRDYIQNNGFAAATLIEQLRKDYPNASKGTVVTGSMGGLIARWTALYMEQNEGNRLYGPHNLEKIITLDTPHEGAVMPMGLQYAIDHIATRVFTHHGNPAREGRKVFQSPAACQMLVQQFTPHWRNQNDPQPHKDRAQFVNEMKQYGNYPKDVKMYAVSNGSKIGQGQQNHNRTETLQPGDLLLSGAIKVWNLNVLWVNHLKASPNFTSRNEEGLEIMSMGIPAFPAWANVKKSLPYDSCPGGNYPFIPTLGSQLNSDRKMPFPSTCFIPATSSVGIVTDNLYQPIDTSQPGPFEAIFAPDENQPHASINAANEAWIFNVLGIR